MLKEVAKSLEWTEVEQDLSRKISISQLFKLAVDRGSGSRGAEVWLRLAELTTACYESHCGF